MRAERLPARRPRTDAELLAHVLHVLLRRNGIDFAKYGRTGIRRRLLRAMKVRGIESLREYDRVVAHDPAEADRLTARLLVPVTSFFRDPEAFAVLERRVLPHLLAERPDGHVLRVWVPGCSTGEEPYSLAMMLTEAIEGAGRQMGFRIFATDVNRDGIDVARRGFYPAKIAAAVSAERLAHFFTAEPAGYRVRPSLRSKIVFAHQDLLQDPPFIHLDLLSCRNVLIYLDPEAQKSVLAKFRFALVPGGILFLGSGEATRGEQSRFEVEDSHWKIYRRPSAPWPFPGGERRRREGLLPPAHAARNG